MKEIEVEIQHDQLSKGVTVYTAVMIATVDGIPYSEDMNITLVAPKSNTLEELGDKVAQEFRSKHTQ